MDQKKKLTAIARKAGCRVRKAKRFEIVFGVGSQMTIYVDHDRGPRVWEWSMLHEIGHAQLLGRRERSHINTFYRMFRMTFFDYKPTEAFYREYLEMEWKAWEQGMKIAKKEGIRVNEKGYWAYARKCWKTYEDNLRSDFE